MRSLKNEVDNCISKVEELSNRIELLEEDCKLIKEYLFPKIKKLIELNENK